MFRNVPIILTVVLFVTLECDGHLGLLDIVGHAHEHIHSTVDKVAGGILGGLNVNFQGQFGVGGQRYPNQQPQRPMHNGGQQTVVVVVEEDNSEESGMRPHTYGQRPNNNNYPNNQPNRPGYNNQGQWNGNYHSNQQGNQNYGNEYQNNGNYGRPNHHHQPNPNQGQNNYQQHPPQNNGNNGEYYGNNQNQFDRTTQGYNGNKNEDNNQHNQPTTPKQEVTRPYGTIHVETTEKPATEKHKEKDEPLFVPLNDYNYVGGNGKGTNDPKREVDNGQKAEDDKDEDLPIDIRFQNQ